MDSYRKLYFYLFRAMARATAYLEQGAVVLSYEQLISAQREAEDACMELDIIPDT